MKKLTKLDTKRNLRKAYAASFSSYLVSKLATSGWLGNINRIILFGSVAESTATDESDMDIFVEFLKPLKKLERDIQKMTEQFYLTRESAVFKVQDVENKINVIVGQLDKWGELKDSIISTGIILWGHFSSSQTKKGKKHLIFFWDSIKINRGAFLNKLYGVRISGKTYLGLLEKRNGTKLGKSCIMIPAEFRNEFTDIFKA